MINCSEHGVRQIDVPWAEENSRFTALFDSLVIDWLHEASIKAVAQRLRISWGAVDGIMQRAVARGLIRRDPISTGILAVDEKAYKKRHKYLTVVSDGSRVLHVADKRREDSLAEYFRTLESDQKQRIRWVSMDMWAPYIRATTEHLPHGANKIAFDRFHVAKQFNDAVDFVRRKEHKALIREGDSSLKGTKYYLAPQRRPR
jgi:transposase